MSYTIIYDKQFVKVNDKYLPFVLGGSNNLYETSYNGKERRCRSWTTFGHKNILSTEKELIDFTTNMLDRQVVRERDTIVTTKEVKRGFGYFTGIAISPRSTHNTTFTQYLNIFKNGIKNAITIEQLKDFNCTLRVETSHYDLDKLNVRGLEPFSTHIDSTKHLLEVLELRSDYIEFMYVKLNGSEELGKRVRKALFTKPKKNVVKKKITLSGYWTVKTDNGFYFVRNIKGGYKYSSQPYFKFATESEAKRKLKNSTYSLEYIKKETELLVSETIYNKLK